MTDETIIERRSSPQVDMQTLQTHLHQAIVSAIKDVAKDPEFSKTFWRRGFEELSAHGADGASQWIGKKLLVWAATAIVATLLVWLVRTGAIK